MARLHSYLKMKGMSFRKGSIIATLDKHDFEVQYNAAKAVFEQSEKETKRIQALFENNTVSPNDYEKVIAANKVAEAKFNAAEDALRYTEIKAPFDCFISDIFKNSERDSFCRNARFASETGRWVQRRT